MDSTITNQVTPNRANPKLILNKTRSSKQKTRQGKPSQMGIPRQFTKSSPSPHLYNVMQDAALCHIPHVVPCVFYPVCVPVFVGFLVVWAVEDREGQAGKDTIS